MVIGGGASDNRIGTDGNSVDDVGERNIISGSGNDGIDIFGAGTDGNVVAGNFIGTDPTGTRRWVTPARRLLGDGASFNWIGVNPDGGTALADEGNVISGNGSAVSHRTGRMPTSLPGTRSAPTSPGPRHSATGIGVYIFGSAVPLLRIRSAGQQPGPPTSSRPMGVRRGFGYRRCDRQPGPGKPDRHRHHRDPGTRQHAGGVEIDDGASGNTIGGVTAAAGNLITNNGGPGVAVGRSTSDLSIGNQITANRIFGNTGPAIDLGSDGGD